MQTSKQNWTLPFDKTSSEKHKCIVLQKQSDVGFDEFKYCLHMSSATSMLHK